MSMRILAVDDEPLFLEILEASLQEIGFHDITPIYSAKEALRELEQSKEAFDCILLDIRMPGMNGVELCRKIRATQGYKRTPIMMVTAMTDRNFIDEAFVAGASDYLTKPLDKLELRARMKMVERLIAEQARNLLLEQHAASDEPMDTGIRPEDLEFTVETPVILQGFDRIIEYTALENYLQSLSTKESYGASAFAISIKNVSMLFNSGRPMDFMNMLYDVGVSIEAVLKSSMALIAYSGNGVFLAVLSDVLEPDVKLVEDRIRVKLKDFDQIYMRDGMPSPDILVGSAIRKSLFFPHASQMLQTAITALDEKPVSSPPPLLQLTV